MVYDILWRVHAILMSSAYIAIIAGIFISLIYKKRKWRYKIHKNLGIFAGFAGLTALVLAVVMVERYSGVHFTSRHGMAGGLTGLFLIAAPLVGRHIAKSKNKKRIKQIHRIMGYGTFLLMTITILMGMMLTGIFSLSEQPPVDQTKQINNENNLVNPAVGGIIFEWAVSNGQMDITLKSPGTGWIAVGFNPKSMMEGADFYIGYVSNEEVFIRDDYGTWLTSHSADEEVGGTSNIIVIEGVEDKNGTILKFRIPLNSGDKFDHQFVSGESIPVILAYSNNDDYTGMHNQSGKTEMVFEW